MALRSAWRWWPKAWRTATAERLAQLGCPFVQGYHFGRPEPVAAVAARLASLDEPIAAA